MTFPFPFANIRDKTLVTIKASKRPESSLRSVVTETEKRPVWNQKTVT